jgi:Tfp pilus assembly protein PilF
MMNTISSAYAFGTARKRIWLSTEGVSREEFFAHVGYGINSLFTNRSKGKRWIDHSNSTTYCLEEVGRMFPQAKFLHIVRDGRDTVNSMIHFKPTQPWALDFSTACKNWKHFVTLGLHFEEQHPDRVLRVSYETIVADPWQEFDRISSFLNLTNERGVVEFFSIGRINSSFSPSEREKMDWRVSWQAEQLDRFYLHCGDLMASLGYALPKKDMSASDKAAVEHRHQQAVQLAERGDCAGAVDILEQCASRFPGHAVIHNDLGVLYAALGDGQRAWQHSRIAVDLDPYSGTFLKNLGDVTFIVRKNPAEALDFYWKALKLDMGDKEVLLAMSSVFLALGRFRHARAFIDRCLHLDPSNGDAMRALAELEARMKDKK